MGRGGVGGEAGEMSGRGRQLSQEADPEGQRALEHVCAVLR